MLPKTIEIKNKRVYMINQLLIPQELKIIEISTIEEMFDAIRTMIVRGAPAIGVSGAIGLALFIKSSPGDVNPENLRKAAAYLISARPTAVNLAWAVNKTLSFALSLNDTKLLQDKIWEFVSNLAEEDERINRAIGNIGANHLHPSQKLTILTHCNAGSLATVYWGTALGVIRELQARNMLKQVFADETRPRLQGGKITAWELMQDKIPVTVITDNMAAYVMKNQLVDAVIVGADRIAANGDTANKIGTYSLAINADYHKVPFYIAAPISTFDFDIKQGDDIEIEQRESTEVTHINGTNILPASVDVINPSFDVTPASLITGIITEKAVIQGDFTATIQNLLR